MLLAGVVSSGSTDGAVFRFGCFGSTEGAAGFTSVDVGHRLSALGVWSAAGDLEAVNLVVAVGVWSFPGRSSWPGW